MWELKLEKEIVEWCLLWVFALINEYSVFKLRYLYPENFDENQ